MKKVVTRRQVLRGTGGVTLGLPFLPSLLPGPAYGADPVFKIAPRFVAITNMHGGVREAAMYPADSLFQEETEVHPGHKVRRGALKLGSAGGDATLSSVLKAPAAELTEKLAGKINILRGLDIPFYIAHNTGMLGNFSRNDGNGDEGRNIQAAAMPTIDQVMAWSNNFYKNLDGIKLRAMVTDFIHQRVSWTYSNPAAKTGSIQGYRTTGEAGDMFTRIFAPPTNTTPSTPAPPPRPPILANIKANYSSLRESNRRLSAEDRRRLDDHIAKIAELERTLNTGPGTSAGGNLAACKDAKSPSTAGGAIGRHAAFNSVIATAFLCNTSRVAVVGCDESDFMSFSGSWHQDVAHQWSGNGPQALLQQANQLMFRHVFLDLLRKLDVEEAPGQTVLDNTLVLWTNECAEETHDARSIPVLMAGGAGGTIKTGQYIDYRNRTPKGMRTVYGRQVGYTGLLYRQMLATCLQAVGVPASEFQGIANNGPTGYGHPFMASDFRTTYVTGVEARASDFLPFLKA